MEPLESWESLDSEFLRDLLLLGGVNLGNKEWWIVFGESLGSLLVFWSKFFAVTAPWCIEFNEKELVFLDFIVEVVVGKNENSVIGLNSRYNVDCKKCN